LNRKCGEAGSRNASAIIFLASKRHELPRYVLVEYFQTFELHDLDGGSPYIFPTTASRLHERFGFILGVEKRHFAIKIPVNIEASEIMASSMMH